MARGLLGKNSPIHIRQRRRDALKEADVVILAGKHVDLEKTYLNLWIAEIILGNIKIYFSFLLFLNTDIVQVFINLLMEVRDPCILHGEHHVCWWHGDAMNQGICSHGLTQFSITVLIPEVLTHQGLFVKGKFVHKELTIAI